MALFAFIQVIEFTYTMRSNNLLLFTSKGIQGNHLVEQMKAPQVVEVSILLEVFR